MLQRMIKRPSRARSIPPPVGRPRCQSGAPATRHLYVGLGVLYTIPVVDREGRRRRLVVGPRYFNSAAPVQSELHACDLLVKKRGPPIVPTNAAHVLWAVCPVACERRKDGCVLAFRSPASEERGGAARPDSERRRTTTDRRRAKREGGAPGIWINAHGRPTGCTARAHVPAHTLRGLWDRPAGRVNPCGSMGLTLWIHIHNTHSSDDTRRLRGSKPRAG